MKLFHRETRPTDREHPWDRAALLDIPLLALGGDRAQIRALSAHHALDMARRYLTHQMTEGE